MTSLMNILGIICLLFLLVISYSEGRTPLNAYIRHHETLSYNRKDVHSRARRALALSPFANVHLKFEAYSRNYSLHLTRNHEIFAADFRIIDGRGNKVPYDYSRFYNGDVEGFHRSHCHGLIEEGRFQGSIYTPNDVFHIEPAERYYNDHEERGFHSVMYSVHDVDMGAMNFKSPEPPARPTSLKNADSLAKQMKRAEAEAEARAKKAESKEEGKKRYRRGTKNRHKNTCNLKLVADHLFMRKFVRRETAIDEMVYHYQAVEYIFRNQTFNTTDKLDSSYSPEGIGFRIKEVKVFLQNTIPKELAPAHMSAFRLLELFSERNHSGVCLAYLFTDRTFDDGVMGLAYIAYPYGQPGGICDPYAMYGQKMKSYNTGILSFRLYNREAPHALTKIAFAHELGHSFGAQVLQ